LSGGPPPWSIQIPWPHRLRPHCCGSIRLWVGSHHHVALIACGCSFVVERLPSFSILILLVPLPLPSPLPTANMHCPPVLTRQKSNDSFGPRKTTPWIASPLAKRAPEHDHQLEETKSRTAEQVVEFDESQHDRHQSHSAPDEPVFREHHESSTVELFFDLFFVANLASFTANHEIVDANSLKNYVGFFTLLWFTWLQYSLFDVRFSTGKHIRTDPAITSAPYLTVHASYFPG
jgi:hypothetical protein